MTYFEYLSTVDERFAYALNRIEKKVAKATTSPQEKCVMMVILCLLSRVEQISFSVTLMTCVYKYSFFLLVFCEKFSRKQPYGRCIRQLCFWKVTFRNLKINVPIHRELFRTGSCSLFYTVYFLLLLFRILIG